MNYIKYCKNCLYPNSKPHLFFDKNGICVACISFEKRKQINFQKRKLEFSELVDKYKDSTTVHDCVVPVSGGKDSTYQVLKVLEYGMKPLCVTATTDSLTDIGRKNLENIKSFGVDHIELTLNQKLRRKINKFAIQTIGDLSWPEHVAIFTLPIRIALQHNIKLIIWGENSQFEYGGPKKDSKKSILDHNWLQEFGGMGGLRVDDLFILDNINEKDLTLYKYPDKSELDQAQIRGIFLGYFFPWDSEDNKIISEKNGFSSWDKNIEGSYYNYENLDNYQTGIHDYFCFLKFGYGRATAQLSQMVRRGKISRKDALKYVIENEGKFPTTYLDKPLEQILEEIDMKIDEFINICDKFTNKKLFSLNKDGTIKKDNNLNIQKINYDNISS